MFGKRRFSRSGDDSFSLTILRPFKKVSITLVQQKTGACNIVYCWQVSIDFIIFSYIITYRLSLTVSDWLLVNFEVILYSASSHAPKSISLQRSEQKGKYFVRSDRVSGGTLTVFLQTGHL